MAARLNEEEKQEIAVLFASGMSYYAIGKKLGRDNETVRDALKDADVQVYVKAAQERIGLKFIEVNARILNSITAEDIQKASLRDKMVASGISLDKGRLALGLTTENIGLGVHITTNSPELRALLDGQS